MKSLIISKAGITERHECPDAMFPGLMNAASLDAELHNRDNPDDLWVVGEGEGEHEDGAIVHELPREKTPEEIARDDAFARGAK